MSQQFDVKAQHMNSSGVAVPYRTRLKGAVVSHSSGATGETVFYDTDYLAATYTRTLTTVTVTTVNPHNLFTNQWVYLDFITGGALDETYQITVTGPTTFTITTAASGSISTSTVNIYGVLAIVDSASLTAVNVVIPDQGILAKGGIGVTIAANTTATIFYG